MEIELKQKTYDELSKTLIEKVIEIEHLYLKMFENCKHKSGWCKKGDCKNCQYVK